MRNPDRIEPLLELVKKIWKKYPDLRLTQLLSNAALSSDEWSDNDLYYLEDDKLYKALTLYLVRQ